MVVHNTKLTQELKKVALSNHVDLIGVADPKVFDDMSIEDKPMDVLGDAKAVVVYGIKYRDTCCWLEESWVSQMEELLARVEKNLETFLNEKGYKAHSFLTEGNPRHHHEQIKVMFLSTKLSSGASTFQSREKLSKVQIRRRRLYSKLQDAAISAGLGCYGKNGVIITPEYGPYVYPAIIITNAPLKPDKPYDKNLCANCNLCVESCPTGACTGLGHLHGESKCRPIECRFTCHRVCYEKIQAKAAEQ